MNKIKVRKTKQYEWECPHCHTLNFSSYSIPISLIDQISILICTKCKEEYNKSHIDWIESNFYENQIEEIKTKLIEEYEFKIKEIKEL